MVTSWVQSPKNSELSDHFMEEFHANTIFIDTLRKQTQKTKIEEMMSYIQRIKSQSQLKDKLIAQLRKKQAESKITIMKTEQQKRESFQQKLKLQRAQIEELLQQNKKLQQELQMSKHQRISTFQNGKELERMKSIYSEENRRLVDEAQSYRQQVEKWKEKYYNCRQQCHILRAEYEQQCKISAELQSRLSISYERVSYNTQNQEKTINKLRLEIDSKTKKCQELSRINQMLEDQINSIMKQYETRIRQYQKQFKLISQQLVKIESEQRNWKNKYLQLVETIECVNKLRKPQSQNQ